MTYCKIDVNNCSSSLLHSALAHFCSRLVLIFALGSCSFLFSARAQFCSRHVLIFVLGSCSFLFSARAHFCSATTARTHFRSPTVARTRDLPGHRSIISGTVYLVVCQQILWYSILWYIIACGIRCGMYIKCGMV